MLSSSTHKRWANRLAFPSAFIFLTLSRKFWWSQEVSEYVVTKRRLLHQIPELKFEVNRFGWHASYEQE